MGTQKNTAVFCMCQMFLNIYNKVLLNNFVFICEACVVLDSQPCFGMSGCFSYIGLTVALQTIVFTLLPSTRTAFVFNRITLDQARDIELWATVISLQNILFVGDRHCCTTGYISFDWYILECHMGGGGVPVTKQIGCCLLFGLTDNVHVGTNSDSRNYWYCN